MSVSVGLSEKHSFFKGTFIWLFPSFRVSFLFVCIISQNDVSRSSKEKNVKKRRARNFTQQFVIVTVVSN